MRQCFCFLREFLMRREAADPIYGDFGFLPYFSTCSRECETYVRKPLSLSLISGTSRSRVIWFRSIRSKIFSFSQYKLIVYFQKKEFWTFRSYFITLITFLFSYVTIAVQKLDRKWRTFKKSFPERKSLIVLTKKSWLQTGIC